MINLLHARLKKFIHERLEYNGTVPVWVPKGYVWARLRSRPQHIKLQAGVEQQHVTHLLQFRAGPNVKPGDRFTIGNMSYELHLIHDLDGRGRWLECFCEASALRSGDQ